MEDIRAQPALGSPRSCCGHYMRTGAAARLRKNKQLITLDQKKKTNPKNKNKTIPICPRSFASIEVIQHQSSLEHQVVPERSNHFRSYAVKEQPLGSCWFGSLPLLLSFVPILLPFLSVLSAAAHSTDAHIAASDLRLKRTLIYFSNYCFPKKHRGNTDKNSEVGKLTEFTCETGRMPILTIVKVGKPRHRLGTSLQYSP